jgi:sugar O-acyltransferase (sialic acid O-acetyltransferase NeuD family)
MTAASSLPLLIVFGAGGHGRVVVDAALASASFRTVVASDRDPSLWGQQLLPGVPIVSPAALHALPKPLALHVAIGNNLVRQKEALALRDIAPLVSVIHPRASVAQSSRIAPGCLLAAHCVVGPLAELDEGVIVNHGAVVDHDCRIGAWSHIAPLAALGGAVRVGTASLVGAGSVVLRDLTIGAGVTLGAGGVALKDVPAGQSWAGVPARPLEGASA